MEGQWILTSSISTGFNFGWNIFNEKLSGEFTQGTKTLTGTQLRYINSYPMMIEGRYHIGNFSTSSITPYFGVGVGTIYNEKRTEMGIFVSTTDQWQFGLVPAVGALIPVGFSSMINIGVKYNYAFEAGDMMANSFLTVNVGYVWGQ